MTRRVTITFVDEQVSAVAELLEDEAPKSCAAVVAALPFEGMAHHATFSGSEVMFYFEQDLGIGRENATTRVIPGDLAYARIEGGEWRSIPQTISELCWFYDRDAVPAMPDGLIPVNLIGRFVEGFEEFAAVCRRMRREGEKRIKVTVE
jgi:hypothetical protein